MAQSKKIDMTTGPIMKKVLLFALPIIIGNILQQLYTTVDTLVVGNFCGDESLAAVGTSAQPVEVLLCIFLGIGSGVSILISQYIGAKDYAKVRDTAKTAVFFVYISGIIIGILGFFAAPWILKIMGVPGDAFEPAVNYTRIMFFGTLGNIGYNMNAGILRGIGDSKASLWFLVVSCIANILLDLLFVAVLGMDAGGAALSTIIAMYISWAVSIWYIRRKFSDIEFPIIPRGFSATQLRRIMMIGVPIGLNNSLFSFGHMAMQTLVNAQGTTFMAGASVAGRITGCTNVAITAVSSAATTFSGQNYGAGNIIRLRQGYIKIPAINGIVTLSLGLAMISFRMPLLRLFSKDETVLLYASRYVVVTLLSQWAYAVFNSISCIVNGVGQLKYTTLINLLMLWAVRIPSAYLIDRFFDGTYIMVSPPISFYFGMFCMIGYYVFSKKWKAVLAQDSKVEMA